MTEVNTMILRSKNIVSQNINGKDIKIFNPKKLSEVIVDVWQFVSTFNGIGGKIICKIGDMDVGARMARLFDLPASIQYNGLDFNLELSIEKDIVLEPLSSYLSNKYAKRLEVDNTTN